MVHRRSLTALFLLATLGARTASAQTPRPAAPAPAATPATAPQPSEEPPLPDVADPLLAPPPPPTQVLQSWQQGVQLVRDQSVNMRLARANIAQAEAQAREALAPALPSLVGQGSVNYHLITGTRDVGINPVTFMGIPGTVPDPRTFWLASLGLTVPIFRPKAWFDHGSAKDAVEAARLSSKESERQVVALVADSIVNVVTNERLAEVSRTSLKAALSTLDLTKRRAALGASNTLDVLRAEGEASLSRAQVVAATEALIRAREALGSALGSSEAWGVTPQIQIDSLAADAQRNCRQETDVQSRSDVRAANANVSLANRRVKGIDFAYLPTLDANSVLTYSDPVSGINNRHTTWTVGALLTWTIYDGGLRGGQREELRADEDLARANLAETKRGATLQVTQAFRAVQVAESNLAVSAKTREVAAETARLTRISFLNGSGTSFDLVDSAQKLRNAEVDLAVKEFEVLRAKVAALLALSTCDV